MKCFYHKSDLDGHCSGQLILNKYPECEMIGVDYKDSIYNFKINKGETIFIVDFRFPIEEMFELNKIANVYWIDHHKSSIDEADSVGFTASGDQLLEIGKAGCELVYEYLHDKIPEKDSVVYLLGRYDVWDNSSSENILPFQYGMRQTDTFPGSKIWDVVFNTDITNEIISTGKTIIYYENYQNKIYAKSMSYEAMFEGYRAIVVNKPMSNSQVFDSIYDPNKHDIMIVFGYKKPDFKYSIFCNKPEIDVSIIAKKYGGGGHTGASGFYSKDLLI